MVAWTLASQAHALDAVNINVTNIDDKNRDILVGSIENGVKVLGSGDVPRPLTVRAHAFSRQAREKIEAAGGKTELVNQG